MRGKRSLTERLAYTLEARGPHNRSIADMPVAVLASDQSDAIQTSVAVWEEPNVRRSLALPGVSP